MITNNYLNTNIDKSDHTNINKVSLILLYIYLNELLKRISVMVKLGRPKDPKCFWFWSMMPKLCVYA